MNHEEADYNKGIMIGSSLEWSMYEKKGSDRDIMKQINKASQVWEDLTRIPPRKIWRLWRNQKIETLNNIY